MKSLYSEKEFKEANSRQLLPLECKNCNCTFFKTKHQIFKSMGEEAYDKKDFCSHKCQGDYIREEIFVNCLLCGASFVKRKSQIKKHPNHFCCSSHAATWNNTHKTKGTRVSKLEKWIAIQLKNVYPKIEFEFNNKNTINSELDIYIPSLKLAFELNGIFHYEPIYGDIKLKSIINNDHRKILACAEKDIELCVIDISGLKYFKEQNANKYLEIIKNILNDKISRQVS